MKYFIVALLGFFTLGSLSAAQLALDVNMENSLLLAGKPQVTYIKVGLKGFEWTRAGDRAPLNVALVLDRSGSMEGEKLNRAKEAARYAVELLGPKDILSIVTYESEVQVLLPATKVQEKRAILRAIDRITSAGSTALFAGVSKGASEVRKFLSKEQVNRVILLSDGMANVGPDSPGELADLGSSLRKEGISVTTVGLGLDYNEDLMTRLSQASDGNHAFVQEPRDLVKIFDSEFKDALSVVARDVEIRMICAPGIKPLRILNREGDIKGQEVILNLNQVYSAQEKYFLVEVEVPALTAGVRRPVAEVASTYLNLQTSKKEKLAMETQVTGTATLADQTRSRRNDVAEAVALQKNVAAGQKAIEYRDAGDTDKAKKILMEAAMELKDLAQELDSPELAAQGAAAASDAENIQKEEEWQVQRKSMRASQYSTENQQSY